MARTAVAEVVVETTIEQGEISFLYRPRVEEQEPDELDDVQRLLFVLRPADSAFERAIAVGRKRFPPSGLHERFWGFVDLVLTPFDMHAALGAQVYGTKSRGLRHLPATREFARGTYEVSTHDSHAHLRWQVEETEAGDAVAQELTLEQEADYLVTIANPDPTAWGLLETPDLQGRLFDDLELHVPLPTPFPPDLQRQFRDRRFVQLDSTRWLDHPGAEIVFVGTGS